jgi:hypothetical protein
VRGFIRTLEGCQNASLAIGFGNGGTDQMRAYARSKISALLTASYPSSMLCRKMAG